MKDYTWVFKCDREHMRHRGLAGELADSIALSNGTGGTWSVSFSINFSIPRACSHHSAYLVHYGMLSWDRDSNYSIEVLLFIFSPWFAQNYELIEIKVNIHCDLTSNRCWMLKGLPTFEHKLADS